MALVTDLVGKVLQEVAAAEDVQQLEAAADRESGQIALERRLEQPQLPRVAAGLRRVGRWVPVGPVVDGVDVDAAREDDAVEHVERLVDGVLARRHDDRSATGLLDRVDVVQRHECGGQLPRPPTRRLRVRGDADHRTTASGHDVTLPAFGHLPAGTDRSPEGSAPADPKGSAPADPSSSSRSAPGSLQRSCVRAWDPRKRIRDLAGNGSGRAPQLEAPAALHKWLRATKCFLSGDPACRRRIPAPDPGSCREGSAAFRDPACDRGIRASGFEIFQTTQPRS